MPDSIPTIASVAPRAPATATPAAALCGLPLGEILVHTAGLAPEKVEEALAAQRGDQAGVHVGDTLDEVVAHLSGLMAASRT